MSKNDEYFDGIKPEYIANIMDYLKANGKSYGPVFSQFDESNNVNKSNVNKIPTPREIVKFLDERVIGQNELKKTLAVAVYNHYKRIFKTDYNNSKYNDVNIEKSNILVLGNTGTGKTFTVKSIAEMLGVPCFIADCTKLTEAGYVGDDVETILYGLFQTANFDKQLTERGIIILDEIDKIARKSENVSITRDVSGEGVQQGLLKIVEGGKIGITKSNRKNPNDNLIYIDTTNILFIALGAFDGIDKRIEDRTSKKSTIGFRHNDNYKVEKTENENILEKVTTEDIKNYGIIPELLGRFPIITYTNPLTEENLIDILMKPKNSIIKQYQKLLDMDGVTLKFNKQSLKYIAHIALSNNIGARGLRGILEKILIDIMFDSSEKKGDKILINEKYIRNKIIVDNEKVA